MNHKVLIVEDEPKLAELLQDYLQQASIDTLIVGDGDKAIAAIESFKPNLLLLDIMLPNKDGLTLCREIRSLAHMQSLPIIMTTAKVDEIDRLLGLEMGADDYICKPYSPREVVARVKAVLRRHVPVTEQGQTASGLTLDNDRLQATLGSRNLQLTAVEYALLKAMVASPGRVFSRSQLMDTIYSDYRVVSERTIDSHIKKLRQKIALHDNALELVHSVYGAGYKFEETA